MNIPAAKPNDLEKKRSTNFGTKTKLQLYPANVMVFEKVVDN